MAFHHPKGAFRGHGGAVDGAQALAEYLPGQNSGFVLMWTMQKEFSAAEIVRNYLTRNLPKPDAPKPVPVEGGLERLAGHYQSIAVRQPFGEAFEAILALSTVEAKAEHLIIGGKKFTHVGGMRFQRENYSVPTLVFDVSGKEPKMLGAGASVRLQGSVWLQRMGWLASFAALSLFAVLHFFVWTYGILSGRLKSRGGLGLRFLPLMALGSIWAFVVLVSAVSSLDTAALLPALGTQSYWSLAIFASTLAIPVLGFLSFWRALTAGYGASGWMRIYGMTAGAVVLTAAVYLNDFGWIGMMSWAR
jgi:hypothetical protein